MVRLFVVFSLAAMWPAAADDRTAADVTGKWLVDRGRHVGLQTGSAPSKKDAEEILVWMLAAARVSPQQPEPHGWQYDLAARLGRTEAALAALRTYVHLKTDDVAARLAFLDMSLDELQTAERRIAFCRSQLPTLPAGEAVSDVERRLAELHQRRGDLQAAAEHATRAVSAFAGNAAARQLLATLEDRASESAARVDSLLASIASSGGTAGELWDFARLLDALSLHERAQPWYEQALNVFQRNDPAFRPPVDFLLDEARSAYDSGDYQRAFEHCTRAQQADPAQLNVKLLLIRTALKLGRHELAQATREEIALRCRQVEADVLERGDALSAAQIAWFHLEFDPDTARAAKFADAAYAIASGHPAIARVYGLSRLVRGDLDEAQKVLEPLAETDQLAAEGLARVFILQNSTEQAIAVLRRAESLRYTGTAHEKIVKRLEELGQSPAQMPDRADVIAALDRFDQGVLRFAAIPAEYLALEAAFDSAELPYAEPFLCRIRLTNRGSFPITLGEGRMVSPQVLVSVSLHHGDGVPSVQAGHYLSLPLGMGYALGPGQVITHQQTLDVGPARELAQGQPQRRCVYVFSLLLDPVLDAEGKWTSRLRGFAPAEVTVVRAAVDASPPGLEALLTDRHEGAVGHRLRAADAVGALLAERRQAAGGSVPYPIKGIDAPVLRQALLAALKDESPYVRARAADAVGRAGLQQENINAVAPTLNDPHWLARLVAMDMLATRQGRVFEPVLQSMARKDGDPLVRRLASLHLEKWQLQDTPSATPE